MQKREAAEHSSYVEDSWRTVSAGQPVARNLCHSLQKRFGDEIPGYAILPGVEFTKRFRSVIRDRPARVHKVDQHWICPVRWEGTLISHP